MSKEPVKQTAVVFGASRAFGAEIVFRLAADDYRVVAVDATLPRIDPKISGVSAKSLDATDPDAVAALFNAEGVVDVVVLNAPVSAGNRKFTEITDSELDDAVDRSVTEPTCVVHAALGALAAGGRVVMVASRAHLGAWGGAHIMAAGAAAITMSRVMALELEKSGVRVNVAAPEFIEEVMAIAEGPKQVATVVAFLASPASAPISGQTILVNGVNSLGLRESVRRELP